MQLRQGACAEWSSAVVAGLQLAILALTMPAAAQSSARGSEYAPMEVGDWLLYPNLLVGAVANDNILNTASGRIAGVGTNFQPSFLAAWSNGLHNVQLYGQGLAQIYPGQPAAGNTIMGQVGFNNVNEVGSDMIWQTAAELGHLRNDLKPTFLGTSFPTTASAQNYDQFLGSASFRKTFNLFYIEGGISGVGQDSNTLSGEAVNVRFRQGYALLPMLSVFFEPSYNIQNFRESTFNSSGYSLVAGLVSPSFSLFKGEIYGGYFSQKYQNPAIPAQSGPTYGGTLSWFPTVDLTLTAAVSQAVGLAGPNQNTAFSALAEMSGPLPTESPLRPVVEVAPVLAPPPMQTVGIPQQIFAFTSPGSVTTAVLTATYLSTQALTTSGTIGFQQQEATRISPGGTVWITDINIGYSVVPTWVLNLNYLYSISMSGAAAGNISHNIVTLGLNIRL